MASGNDLTLETVHAEVEMLGSMIRSLSTQVASMRSRVSDLEQWDTPLVVMGKDSVKRPTKKRPPKRPAKYKPRRKRKA